MADSAKPFSTLDILGFSVSTASPAEIDAWLRTTLASERAECRHLVTLNPEYVMAAGREPAFAEALREADIATADGVGIVLAARAIHGRGFTRVTGVDLIERLAAIGGELGAGIFLLGAGPGIGELAAQRLVERFPRCRVAGTWSGGSPDPAHDGEAIQRVAASDARVVLVAYGAVGQVQWIARNRAALAERGVRLAIGVGGALDYLSGSVKRPPVWVQQSGMEWLYRLARERWRWRRQAVLPVFAAKVAVAAAGTRIRRRGG